MQTIKNWFDITAPHYAFEWNDVRCGITILNVILIMLLAFKSHGSDLPSRFLVYAKTFHSIAILTIYLCICLALYSIFISYLSCTLKRAGAN